MSTQVTTITDEVLYKSLASTIEAILVQNKYKELSFYGYMLLTLQKEFVNYSKEYPVMTAGVGLIGTNYKLVINRDFWVDKLNLTPEKRVALLVHEVMHVIYNHPIMGANYSDHDLHNESTDLFINSVILKDMGADALPGCSDTNEWNKTHLPNLKQLEIDYKSGTIDQDAFKSKVKSIPIRGVHPDDYTDTDININNCIDKGSDWLYQKLYKIKEKQDSSGNSGLGIAQSNGLDHPSDHKDWDNLAKELSEEVKEYIKNQQEYILAESLNEFNKSQGILPSYLKELVDRILNPPKPVFDYVGFMRKWISIFGNFTQISRTRSKPALIVPDTFRLTMKPDRYIFIAVDTSGSMSKADFTEVFTEIVNIKRVTNCKIDIGEVDAAMHNVWELKDIHQMNEYLSTNGLSGRGGTNFDPAVEYVNERTQYSGMIYLTDGFVGKPRITPKIPVLAIVSSRGAALDWSDIGITSCQIPKDYLLNK